MMQENRILLVGGCGAGKTTLLDALIGRKILSNKCTSEITCVYNEEAYNEPPTIYNCNNYIGVKFCTNLSKKVYVLLIHLGDLSRMIFQFLSK